MNLLQHIHRRLDRVQRSRSYHIIASAVVVVFCAAFFGTILYTTHSLNSQFREIVLALDGQSLSRNDALAISLRDTGTIVVDGKTYGGEQFRNAPVFDENGTITLDGAIFIANDMMDPLRPQWAPDWLIDQPDTTWLLAIVGTIWLLLIVWMNISLPFVLTVIGTAIPVAVCWWLNAPKGMLAFGGMGLLVFSFVLLTKTSLTLLSARHVVTSILLPLFAWSAGTVALLVVTWCVWWVTHALTIVDTSAPSLTELIQMITTPYLWATAIVWPIGICATYALLVGSGANFSMRIEAVAHSIVKEASRTRLSLVFITMLLIILPLLPLWLDPEAPLRHRIQTFMSRSLTTTFSVAACMSLFLACASVAFEFRDRQIWQLMTKPLGRLQYLIGKWLGVLLVNLILLIVAGISTFTFIQYLRELPVAMGEPGRVDRQAVENEVLAARGAARPVFQTLPAEQIDAIIDQSIRDDPELGEGAEITPAERRMRERQLATAFNAAQRSIAPWDDPTKEPHSRLYVFTGLGAAKRLNSPLTLKYKFHILHDDTHAHFKAGFRFNEDPSTDYQATYVPTQTHFIPANRIGENAIRDDGTFTVRIYNLYQPPPEQRGIGSLNFDEPDLEVLYKVSSFENNFIRAMLTMWIKLAFLAALGVSCATFLSFPVACLLSFTIFFGGLLGPFLAESLVYYGHEFPRMNWADPGMVLLWAFEGITKTIAGIIVYALSDFGSYRPTQNLVEGKVIYWSQVIEGFVRLAVLWSGVALAIGYVVLRKRQLAIYSGQG